MTKRDKCLSCAHFDVDEYDMPCAGCAYYRNYEPEPIKVYAYYADGTRSTVFKCATVEEAKKRTEILEAWGWTVNYDLP